MRGVRYQNSILLVDRARSEQVVMTEELFNYFVAADLSIVERERKIFSAVSAFERSRFFPLT